jgi:hypothetical protein
VKKLTVRELIDELNIIAEKYGDIDCSISIDTSDAFNITKVDDVVVNRYEAQIDNIVHSHYDYPDGTFKYEVCLHGELFLLADDED